ncbi:MAG: transposase [Phycisphaerales bacterium]
MALFSDAITTHGGSGRRSMLRAAERGQMGVSLAAAYGKLRRVPVEVSEALLRGCTRALEGLAPPPDEPGLPASLSGFRGVVLDAQTIKGLARRLTPTRGVPGGVLAGRGLMAMTLDAGLIVEMIASPDGYTNEAALLPEAMPRVRGAIPGPRLWIADRQFCYLVHMDEMDAAPGDAFVLRHRADLRFTPDPAIPAGRGVDARGRVWRERWGTLRTRDRRRRVRLITLTRPGQESVRVVTSLLDGRCHPAHDILEAYLARWGIETVFQQITEVFGLARLIGSSPQAAIFQLALCATWYNVIQALKRIVAPGGPTPASAVSGENLFDDVKRHLIACDVVVPLTRLAEALTPDPTPRALGQRLRTLLGPLWTPRWLRAPKTGRSRPPPRPRRQRHHASAHRLIQKHNAKTKDPTTER